MMTFGDVQMSVSLDAAQPETVVTLTMLYWASVVTAMTKRELKVKKARGRGYFVFNIS